MRNERLIEIRKLNRPGAWPTYYVVTDAGSYVYTGQSFERSDVPEASTVVTCPPEYSGATITDVRGDGESAVIRVASGDVVVFDLLHNPFGSAIESHPGIRFVPKDDLRKWQDDYEAMDPL